MTNRHSWPPLSLFRSVADPGIGLVCMQHETRNTKYHHLSGGLSELARHRDAVGEERERT